MPNPINYARSARRHGVSELRAAMPYGVAIAVAVLGLFCWLIFFTLGDTIAIDTHFTNRPQDHPEFRLTAWRPAPGNAGAAGGRVSRDAVYLLTLRTLRYEQWSDDGGVSVSTERYHADIRWGPTILALVVTFLLPVIGFVGLKRLLR